VSCLKKLGGEARIPFLHDPNTGTKLYESEEIVKYLYEQCGLAREVMCELEIKYLLRNSGISGRWSSFH